jgi:hypothetical protein
MAWRAATTQSQLLSPRPVTQPKLKVQLLPPEAVPIKPGQKELEQMYFSPTRNMSFLFIWLFCCCWFYLVDLLFGFVFLCLFPFIQFVLI